MDGLLRHAVSGIAGGIGLASEGITAHKKRSKDRKNARNTNEDDTPADEPTGQMQNLGLEETPAESTEQEWDLDDAQDELMPEQPEKQTLQDATQIVSSFVSDYPPPAYTAEAGPARLPLPVILPQRRPKDRSRGFIRAYAPVLEVCGIDQPLFLEFLQTFEKASQASPWINAINLAGIGTMFIPGVAGFLAGLAIQISVSVAIEVQTRSRTNTFLDKINDEFFRPRGLYCLVMNWNPESAETSSRVDITSAISSSLNAKTSGMGKIKHNLQSSSGKTYGELDFPETAPLVFPALDKLAEQKGEEAVKKREKMKKGKNFIDEYYDRRAQASFSGKNPNSVLVQGPEAKFTSRYADPNHPASSGSLVSLVTGGHINPPSLKLGSGSGGSARGLGGGGGFRGRDRGLGGGRGLIGSLLNAAVQARSASRSPSRGNDPREQRQDQYRESAIDTRTMGTQQSRLRGAERQNQAGLLGLQSPGAIVKKAMKKNVLYLMIVNMPSEEEMAAAVAQVKS